MIRNNNNRPKISDEQVREIRKRFFTYGSFDTYQSLAEEFNVSYALVQNVISYRDRFYYVEDEEGPLFYYKTKRIKYTGKRLIDRTTSDSYINNRTVKPDRSRKTEQTEKQINQNIRKQKSRENKKNKEEQDQKIHRYKMDTGWYWEQDFSTPETPEKPTFDINGNGYCKPCDEYAEKGQCPSCKKLIKNMWGNFA